jgi:membrane fusion protein (multidrug efflux system)
MTTIDRVSEAIPVTRRGEGEQRTGQRLNIKTLVMRAAGGAVLIAVVALGCVAGLQYWNVGRFMESTDDAYVAADSTIIAPRVAGYISELLVDDNQPVKAGQVLARIDDRDYRTALDISIANVSAAAATIANLDAQITAQDSLIREAEADVAAASAALSLSQRNADRLRRTMLGGYSSAEQADDASTDTEEKAAALQRLQASALDARQQVAVLMTQRQLAQAELARAVGEAHQAELDLSYTNIVAPIDGSIGARTARLGAYVQTGTQLMAVVPLQQAYVIANFKETQLTDVLPGQSAMVYVDTFPGNAIRGRVDSLAPASGLEFSLLPPDNATGNFTKIVQRIPVKIVFPATNALAGALRPGMSVEVSIDNKESHATVSRTAAGQ